VNPGSSQRIVTKGVTMTHEAWAALLRALRDYLPEREPGQGITEYAMVLATVLLVFIFALNLFGGAIGKLLIREAASLS